jgi:hypothetical protein
MFIAHHFLSQLVCERITHRRCANTLRQLPRYVLTHW